MGVKGILGGGMVSDSKTVKRVTDPVKQYAMGAAPAQAQTSNFEQEIKDRQKKVSGAAGFGSKLIS